MAEEKTQTSGFIWYKNWWGILLALAFFPFTLTYLIWTKKEWDFKLKRNFTIGLWAVILIGGLINGYFLKINESNRKIEKLEQQLAKKQQKPNQTTRTPLPSEILSPTKPIKPTPNVDSSKGNNPVAAAYSEELFTLLNNAAAGYVESIFVELSPESTAGKTDKEYIDSVTSVFVQITVNRGLWNTTDDATKKDLMTAWLKHAKGKFSKGFPHIFVDNGLRRVAEAELSMFGEPKIELK